MAKDSQLEDFEKASMRFSDFDKLNLVKPDYSSLVFNLKPILDILKSVLK